jgi:hypothetical protein
VHLEGFAIKVHKGGARFVKLDRVTIDAFAQRSLTLTAPATLLDVAPQVPGTVPPAPFGSDPTSDASVNRLTCYKAKLAKGSPKFVPPPAPTLTDVFYGSGQQFLVTKVTKVCEPTDVDGATAGAETRTSLLVCYALKLPKHTPRFAKTTVATNNPRVVPQVLVASAPAELCLPAQQPSPTPTPTTTPTLSATPTVSVTPSATPTVLAATPTVTVTPSATPTVLPTPGKRVFVTSTTTKGGFGGTSGADAFCAAHATAAGLSGTFKAWLSITGDGPSTRFTQSAVPYGLVDGTIVANDWSDLVDGTLAHAIDVDESGNTVSDDVWTSTDGAGAPLSPNCNNYLDATTASGICGNTNLKNGGWTNNSSPSCSLSLRLYCFEQ